MEIVELNQVSNGIFKKKGICLEQLRPSALITNPFAFKLAIKCCDGSFHTVNSPISEILSGGIGKSEIKMAITALAPTDPIHGQRYVIFSDNGRSFLLGTVETAIMLLASN